MSAYNVLNHVKETAVTFTLLAEYLLCRRYSEGNKQQ